MVEAVTITNLHPPAQLDGSARISLATVGGRRLEHGWDVLDAWFDTRFDHDPNPVEPDSAERTGVVVEPQQCTSTNPLLSVRRHPVAVESCLTWIELQVDE